MSKGMKDYVECVKQYLTITTKICAKPQKLSIAGDALYWIQGSDQQLYRVFINDKDATPAPVFTHLSDETKKLTREEELLLERQRGALTGISSFAVRKSDHTIFYTVSNELFIYYTSGPRSNQPPLDVFSFTEDFLAEKPCLYITHVEEDLTDVIFVYDNNLYSAAIHEQLEDEEEPLKVIITPLTSIGDDYHQCGVADYIIQEEFGRLKGHYETKDFVLFSYVDSSMIRKVTFLKDDSIEEIPYPRVGDENAKTTIVVFDRRKKKYFYLPEYVLQKSLSFKPEYIPRFGFKGKHSIYVEVLNRNQEECATLSYPISALLEVTEKELRQVYSEEGGKTVDCFPPLHVEAEQSIPWAWVEVAQFDQAPIHFGPRFDVMVRHAVETETAHNHLYIRPAGGSAALWKPLTAGLWNVNPHTVKINGDKIFFLANAGARLQQNLFVISVPPNLYDEFDPLDESDLYLLSEEGEFVTEYAVSDREVFYCASTASEISRLKRRTLPSAEEPDVLGKSTPVSPEKWLEMEHLSASADGVPPPIAIAGVPLVRPIIVTVKNTRGVPMSGYVYIPLPSAPCRRTDAGLPLILSVYGGPHVQLVFENNFENLCIPRVQSLVQQGFAVAVVDNQMSNANGLRARSICKKNMGNFETEDYVSFVTQLCASPLKLGLPSSFVVDAARVGIFGWSYGGYATLLALCQAPNIFKMGFSGAPVGDWTLYDTGYTERYLGELVDEETGESPSVAYKNSAIGHFAAGFPDELDRVFIAHGLLDENVHFLNSAHIVSAMTKHFKPYSLLMYPGERHGLRQIFHSRLHHDAMMINTFVEKL